jgi:DNA polymerase III subunit gamma/tau
VIGQDATIKILKHIVSNGASLRQSYLFSGSHGCGKTTLGRILARAILCDSPVDGEPCNQCESCTSILTSGSHECFTEIDAATNSGKDNVRKILEELSYTSYAGKPRIWLFDEAHRLTRDALDAFLKPMEDIIPGTDQRLLVCIFCTTEPEKMRKTVASRCLQFEVKMSPKKDIKERLSYICNEENIPFEDKALDLITHIGGRHIRDSIKLMNIVSQLGSVSVDNVNTYTNTHKVHLFEDIMKNLGKSSSKIEQSVSELSEIFSPMECYKNMMDLSISALRSGYGVLTENSIWSEESLKSIFHIHGDRVIAISKEFSEVPKMVTADQFLIDVMLVHKRCTIAPLNDEETSQDIVTPCTGTYSPKEFGNHLKGYLDYLSQKKNKYG